MAEREYGVDNGDGTISVWGTDDAGNFWPVRTESVAVNQGQVTGQTAPVVPTAPATSSGGGQTREGYLSDRDLQSRLRSAGYGGPWDTQSMIAAFNRAGQPVSTLPGYGSQIDAYNSYLQAVTQSNREQFNAQLAQQQKILDFDKQKWSESIGWEKERWAQQYALDQQKLTEMQRQFNVQAAATDKQSQQSLAMSLLQGATQLQRPESWLDYSTYTQGGRNIFQSLYGSQPVPAFSAPTGYSKPLDMQGLLGQMGLSNAPGMQEALAMSTAPVTGANAQGTQTQPLVPLPHQINPAVWDSFSSTSKGMVLGAAQEGLTPSGIWTADDFLRQLNATRPQGIAPKQINYNWQQPSSYF